MNVSDLVAIRAERWRELELFCDRLESLRRSRLTTDEAVRFASLYRSACADLALAEAYQLPESTVQYVNKLVGRAHNQLHRSESFHFSSWIHVLLVDVPKALWGDRYLPVCFFLFWGVFLLCAALAYARPGFAEDVVGAEYLTMMEDMYSQSVETDDGLGRSAMAGFYVWNNPSIGLQCFAFGLIAGVGGLYITLVNAAILGTAFGHMATTEQSANFFTFVTAHGPFELTAIVLCAAAGMRLGFAWIHTRGKTRGQSIREELAKALPAALTAVVLFILAAGIEAYVSPSPLPYWVKALVAIVTAVMLVCYYFVLGPMAKYSTDASAPNSAVEHSTPQ